MTRDILSGPAVIQYGGTAAANTFYTQDDIIVTHGYETVPVMTSQFGQVDEIVTDRIVEVTATIAGIWAGGSTAFTDKVALVWPHIAATIGGGIFATTQAAEKTLVIWTIADGKKYTYQSAAVTRMPSLTCSSERMICGQMTWRCIEELAVSTNAIQAWSTADSVEVTSSVSFTDTSFAVSDVLMDTYTAAWGSVTGFTAIETQDGFTVDFEVSTTPVKTDGYGVIQLLISDVKASCRFTPVGAAPTLDNAIAAMKIQGTGSARGMSLAGIQSSNLIISGSAAGRPKVTLYSAQLTNLPSRYGMTVTRLGELEFRSTLSSASATKTVAAIATV